MTDKERGYRYQATHPVTGDPWPPIPGMLLDLWRAVAGYPHPPEACLVNFYSETAKMGLHQDRDEADFEAPVVSVSLGDACLFRVGQTSRNGPHRVLQAGKRRRGRAGRRRATVFSRRRPHLSGHLGSVVEGRPDQPDPAARDRTGS